jgi:hypothetical protein
LISSRILELGGAANFSAAAFRASVSAFRDFLLEQRAESTAASSSAVSSRARLFLGTEDDISLPVRLSDV